jgi:hypothetical protein
MDKCIECGKNEVHVKNRQLCNACYLAARKAGTIKAHEKKKSYERIRCRTPECDNFVTIRSKSGFCRKCARKKSWAPPGARQRKNQHLKSLYGITIEDYEKMLEEQNGVCAICSKPETNIDYRTAKPRKLSVDHCHETGKVRRLLCEYCNTGLGKFHHDTQLLKKAIDYLETNN